MNENQDGQRRIQQYDINKISMYKHKNTDR